MININTAKEASITIPPPTDAAIIKSLLVFGEIPFPEGLLPPP